MILAVTLSAQTNSTASVDEKQSQQTETIGLKNAQTVGVAIDLLPPVMSATTGNFGYSAQLWYGYKKYRFRGVIAGFHMPDKLMGNDDFQNLKTRATALIIDCFKDQNFKGWWFGAGCEMWRNTITSKIDKKDYSFNDYVITAGSGYIFKVYKNFYIEPWGAVHGVVNKEKVIVADTKYRTKRFQAEVSLKVGWHF